MRKVLFLLLFCIALLSCSKSSSTPEEEKSIYTPQQQKVQSIFTGQFKEDYMGERYKTIIWGAKFSTPVEYTSSLNSSIKASFMGKLKYYYYDDTANTYDAVYWITGDGTQLLIFGANDANKTIFSEESYAITVINNDEFILRNLKSTFKDESKFKREK